MAAFRSSPQFNGGLKKLYRRFNASTTGLYDPCLNRSLNFRLFSRTQVNHSHRDEQVTRSFVPNTRSPHVTKKQQCSQVKGFYLSHITESCTVDLVTCTKPPVLGTHLRKTSVPVIPINCLRRASSTFNHKYVGCLRYYFTDEFKGHKEETEEVMEVKGHSGSVDPDSPINNEICEFKGHVEETEEVMKVKGHSGSVDRDSPINNEIDEFKGHIEETEEVMEVKGHSGSADAGSLGISEVDGHKPDIHEDGSTDKYDQLISSLLPASSVKMDSYNLAPFVAKSDVLRFLLNLNVNLAKIEAKPNVANSLVRLKMEEDVVPVMLFLKDLGIPDAKLGKVIGLHPYIFTDLDKAKLVVEFLRLKKFKKESITHMIVGAPPILGLKVVTIDQRMGTYQKYFKLTGDETRDVMTRVPRLLLNRSTVLKETIETFKSYEFSRQQLKKIVLQCPSVFKNPVEKNLENRLEYLMTNIPMDQSTIARFSFILLYPSNPIKERHLFLLELGRAQYDPTKESYISPTDLVCTPEWQFCKLVRTTQKTFKSFKMTL